MEVFKQLVTILGGATVVIAAMAYMAKTLMGHLLSKDLEQHKARLDTQTKLELERFQSEMTKQALEHEVKFRRVDEKVAEHLAEIFKRLFTLYECVSNYVKDFEYSDETSKEEKLASTVEANTVFWDYFLPNRIYVPPKLYERIREVADKLADITKDFSGGRRREAMGIGDPEEDYYGKAFDAIHKEASLLFKDLVSDFHRRLGVHDNEEDEAV